MKRTDETARIITEIIGFTGETVIIPELRERLVSHKYEGRLWSEIAQEYTEKFGSAPSFIGLAMLADLDGAESDSEFEKRTTDALQKIQSKYAGKRVLIVAHGNVFRSVYAAVS